jgi:hypothetical protein
LRKRYRRPPLHDDNYEYEKPAGEELCYEATQTPEAAKALYAVADNLTGSRWTNAPQDEVKVREQNRAVDRATERWRAAMAIGDYYEAGRAAYEVGRAQANINKFQNQTTFEEELPSPSTSHRRSRQDYLDHLSRVEWPAKQPERMRWHKPSKRGGRAPLKQTSPITLTPENPLEKLFATLSQIIGFDGALPDLIVEFIDWYTKQRQDKSIVEIEQHSCETCGKKFTRHDLRQKFCGKECASKAAKARQARMRDTIQAMRELNLLVDGD